MIRLIKHFLTKDKLIRDIDLLIKINNDLLTERCVYKYKVERALTFIESHYNDSVDNMPVITYDIRDLSLYEQELAIQDTLCLVCKELEE